MPHGNATRCRHGVIPRRLCKPCKAEDARMRRPPKPKLPPLATRRAWLVEQAKRQLAVLDREYEARHSEEKTQK